MRLTPSTQYLRSLELLHGSVPAFSEYPFSLPAIRDLKSLSFHPRVTFLVGENGSGKSTLLEALAVACGFNPEGGTRNFSFSTRASHSALHRHLRIVRGTKRPRDGFFLRAESFYNLATDIERLDAEGGGPPIIDSYGGRSLHEQSHGESFFATLMNRFGGKGLYLLDEPEAALSPSRQMVLISRLHDLTGRESQFVIATHSPILMAYPDAVILQVEEGFAPVAYEETEHYIVTREFLNNPKKLLDILME